MSDPLYTLEWKANVAYTRPNGTTYYKLTTFQIFDLEYATAMGKYLAMTLDKEVASVKKPIKQ